MAVNQNFVVRNGLEVNESLIHADSTTSKVGIGSTQPTTKLEIQGDLKVVGLATVTGVTSFTSDVNIDGNFNVAGITTLGDIGLSNITISGFSTFTQSADFNSDVDIDGHTELDNLNVSGVSTFASTVNINSDIDVDGHTELDNLNVSGLSTFQSQLTSADIASSGIITATNFSGSGAGLTGIYPIVDTILYVTPNGSDSNTGKELGEAKRTIGSALTAATTGTLIKVSAGSYVENNPLEVPKQVSIVGESLREVSVSPQNSNQDLFHVLEGNYISDMSFTGTLDSGKAVFAFDPDNVGFSSQSPYIQNCTNFIPNSMGLKIDGSKCVGNLKSMVVDSYTQYNQGGIGASITNEGYAQLVSMFTICNDIAIYTESGGQCDLTNSNSSFGVYGLVSEGVGPRKYIGTVNATTAVNADEIEIDFSSSAPVLGVSTAAYDATTGLTTITTSTAHNLLVGTGVTISELVFQCDSGGGPSTAYFPSGNNGYIFEVSAVNSATEFEVYVGVSTLAHTYIEGGTAQINVVRPFDGQVVYFDELYYTVDSVTIGTAGTDYTSNATVTFSDPSESWGIPARGVGEVKNGKITNVVMVSNGRGYTSTPTVTFAPSSTGFSTATGTANLIPAYHVIKSSTPITSGICTITLTDNIPYSVGIGSTVPFFKQSRIIASSHSFEYIGSGNTIATALPQSGGVPVPENEVENRSGGLVIYTSTDQAGNFRIGDGVVVDQSTGNISGQSYSKSLYAQVTPLILALGGV